MEACNVSGAGLVSAKGGPSRAEGSGAGGGGRVSIRAGHVSSQLVECPLLSTLIFGPNTWRLLTIDDLPLCSFVALLQALTSSGGATSGSYSCAGAAGTVFLANGTSFLLILDNANEKSASTTYTPFPGDLNGVQLTQLNISRKASVELRQAKSNNDVRAYGFDLDASSKVTGDSVVIDTSNASVRGSITGSTTVWLHNAQSGAGTVTVHGGSAMACSSCKLKMSLTASDVTLLGSISTGTGEIKGLKSLTHSGNLAVSGSLLSIEAGTASISGTVSCSGGACSSLVSVNETLEMGGSLSCTNGKCSLSLRSGGNMISTGTISCSGNSQCLVDVASGSSAVLSGSMTGSDIRMVVAEALQLQGTVSTSGQGYAEETGDGKGNRPSYSGSSTSYYRVSGSGGGHGGDGATSCYRYHASYGPSPSSTIPSQHHPTFWCFFSIQTALLTHFRVCCLDAGVLGGLSYGSSSFPRTFGSGGGRSCYAYGSCSYHGKGGSGGGRIYMNASSIEITSGATVSADGTQGELYSSTRYCHFHAYVIIPALTMR
jgi:hypothetical protein